jgi:chromosome segregation ATPase
MSSSANVANIAAVRAVRQALRSFAEEVNSALITLDLEARRPIEWIEHDRTQYWPREMRKASDWVSEARQALQRCELTIDADHRKSCYDEKKQLEKAKRRLQLAEEKIQAVKRWRLEVRKEVEEFQTQVAKLQRYLETDLERAVAVLDRMSQSLEKYVEVAPPPSGGEPTSGGAAGPAAGGGDTP